MNPMNEVMSLVRKAFTPIRKSQPGSSNVHVPTTEWQVRKDSTMNPPINNLEATMLNAAFGQPMFPTGSPQSQPRPSQPIGGKPSQSAPKPGTIKPDGQTNAKDGKPGSAGPGKPNTEKAVLDTHAREHIKDTNFALPKERKYPIHDLAHARNALSRSSGKPEESKVRAAVYRKYPKLKPVDKSGDAEVHPTQAPEGGRRVATIAVKNGDKLLMGKRRDNNKWTTPGGHVDDGEDMHTGALRELHEETGMTRLKKRHIKPLSEIHKLQDKDGKPLHVQPFVAETEKRHNTTMKNDPDGEVHRWQWIDVSKGLPDEIAQNLHVPGQYNCLLQELGLAEKVDKDMTQDNGQDAEPGASPDGGIDGGGDNSSSDMQDMGQVIAGMDWELGTSEGLDESAARNIALSNLSDDPDFYRKKFLELDNEKEPTNKDTEQTEDNPTAGMGFNIDIGSGQAREPGHVGVDLYPYDYGTLVHDVNLGLPFEDGSAQNIRMVNSLHEMGDLSDDPKPLLSEIQRVLMPGGEFHYEGPNELFNYPEWLDEQSHDVGVAKGNEGVPEWHRQIFTRTATPDAATADDSEPRIGIAQYDELPADALLAMDALGYYWSDATTSGRGNRLHGYPSQGALVQKSKVAGKDVRKGLVRKDFVPIMKRNQAKQIVYGVVLSPDELDQQDDLMTADDIEQTAHTYLEKSRVVGSGHEKPISAYPVESYIAPQDIEWTDSQYGPQKIKKGAWVLGVKVCDPKEWQKVVTGDYAGFSVGGMGLRDPLN